jgi:hypothetical protein
MTKFLFFVAGLFLLVSFGAHAQKKTIHEARLQAGNLSGLLLDNIANAGRQGSGFNPLHHQDYPGKSVYHDHHVGLNFEHIFNGAMADKRISMFTPRKDTCVLTVHSPTSATFSWPAKESAWGVESSMTYTLVAPNAIDMTFKATPTEDRFPLGYAAFMWASYMNRTRERRIHFIGTEGWTSFGDDVKDGFETGTVSYAGVPDLPYEPDAQALNIIEHPTKKFTKPFYYGLVDGDHDLETQDDTLAYIMMFDQTEEMRFAMWNFMKDEDGQFDPHSPAWDWQFVIRDPKPGKTYAYRARVLIKPFTDREDIEQEYRQWKSGRQTP